MTNQPSPTDTEPTPIRRGGRPSAVQLPAMTEDQFSDKVAELARLNGWMVFHVRPARVKGDDGLDTYRSLVQYDGKGFPDLLMVHPKRKLVAYRELKIKTKLSVDQRRWGVALSEAGADWETWWPSDWPEIVRFLSGGRAVDQ